MYFGENDYYVTQTYAKENRPADMEQAKKDFEKFIDKLRREYKKRGYELRWIRNIECGTKGAWHIHAVFNRIPETDILIAKLWKHGRAHTIMMYEEGQFKELAAYLTKTPKTDSRLKEASYSTSRNMPLPEPEVKIYRRFRTWKEEPREVEGFYLDRDSLHEGENPVTGYRYRVYTLLRRKTKL